MERLVRFAAEAIEATVIACARPRWAAVLQRYLGFPLDDETWEAGLAFLQDTVEREGPDFEWGDDDDE